MRLFFTFLILVVLPWSFIAQSPLADGDIYKVPIDKSGVYKIDQAFLQSLNIATSSITPKQVKVLASPGGMLPELIEDGYSSAIKAIPTLVVDNNDVWDADDKILFYAEAKETLAYDREKKEVFLPMNIYDTRSFIYIKISNDISPLILPAPNVGEPTYSTDSYEKLQRVEDDLYNLLALSERWQGSGKDWYGHKFLNDQSREFVSEFDFDNLVPGSEFSIYMRYAARSSKYSSVKVLMNDSAYIAHVNAVNLASEHGAYASNGVISVPVEAPIDVATLQVESVSRGNEVTGWLDFLQIRSRHHFSGNLNQVTFFDLKSMETEISEFQTVPENIKYVWQIEETGEQYLHQGTNIRYQADGKFQKFVGVTENGALSLSGGVKITNQDILSHTPEMVIVYPQDLSAQAERLAAHRTQHSNIAVATIQEDKIYNAFSSGRRDPTAIRNYARHLKQKGPEFKYLLLFGDGTYDPRDINNNNIPNLLPTYETASTLNSITAYPSDDYFGLLEVGEGALLNGTLDIAVGRIAAHTEQDMRNIVDKIIHYDTSISTLGSWRNEILFTADDEDGNRHIDDADNIARSTALKDGVFNQNKIYFDAYPQESTHADPRYYQASEALTNAINQGMLVVSYLGHGGPNGWAQERVLKKSDIDQWNNLDKLPLMITATCTFAGYDDPGLVSAGEYAIRKPNGGVISLLTTVRAVYVDGNYRLTQAVYNHLFEQDENGYLPIGETLRRAKNSLSGDLTNKRKFTLLGDPSQVLAIPTHTVRTEKINNTDISIYSDTLRSLDLVEVSGSVVDAGGHKLNDFNGELAVTVFDKIGSVTTLVNDPSSKKKTFEVYKNKIYSGIASVTNGSFQFSFIVPKDINYEIGTGRISYYATDGTVDANGYYDEIIIGGSQDNAIVDDVGPTIKLYMDNRQFKDGEETLPNTELIIDLEDDFGINVTGSSIGHDLTAVLDDNTNRTYILNNYYQSDMDSYTKGTARLSLTDLSEGEHSITVTAWDISNNSSTETIHFYVSKNKKLDYTVNVYPVPFVHEINITVNVPSSVGAYNGEVILYDISGSEILNYPFDGVGGEKRVIIHARGNEAAVQAFNLMSKGVYICKINITPIQLDNELESKSIKIMRYLSN